MNEQETPILNKVLTLTASKNNEYEKANLKVELIIEESKFKNINVEYEEKTDDNDPLIDIHTDIKTRFYANDQKMDILYEEKFNSKKTKDSYNFKTTHTESISINLKRWEQKYIQSEEYIKKWLNKSFKTEDILRIMDELLDTFSPTEEDEVRSVTIANIIRYIKYAIIEQLYDNLEISVK